MEEEKRYKNGKIRPKGIVTRVNEPNFELMARIFINLYKEFGPITNNSTNKKDK